MYYMMILDNKIKLGSGKPAYSSFFIKYYQKTRIFI